MATTPLKAIKEKCLDCCAGQREEVKLCTCKDCALYEYRLGKNPNRKKHEVSEETRENASKRFKEMWKQRKEQ